MKVDRLADREGPCPRTSLDDRHSDDENLCPRKGEFRRAQLPAEAG
jgi:hypothetical protein